MRPRVWQVAEVHRRIDAMAPGQWADLWPAVARARAVVAASAALDRAARADDAAWTAALVAYERALATTTTAALGSPP